MYQPGTGRWTPRLVARFADHYTTGLVNFEVMRQIISFNISGKETIETLSTSLTLLTRYSKCSHGTVESQFINVNELGLAHIIPCSCTVHLVNRHQSLFLHCTLVNRHQSLFLHCTLVNRLKPPVLANLRTNITINRTERIRLACKAKSGMPIPSLQWYKEGKRLLPNVRTRIVVKKRKRSILVIKKAEPEDSGVYECRATSATGDVVSSTSRVIVLSPESTTTTKAEPLTTSWPYNEQLCLFSAYCLNGGTCIKTGSLEEIHCVCAEGFKGLRCAEKDVSNKSSTYSTGGEDEPESDGDDATTRNRVPGLGNVMTP
uniref:Protein vein n=1 Tax=Timema monikensis TaxID=170555 RepID=A0A7R9ECD9_9NEOP|nr:unnamed protein product [Timema monikensis]